MIMINSVSSWFMFQVEEAVELYMVAGRPRAALALLNAKLGDAVEGAAGGDAGKGWLFQTHANMGTARN